MNTPRYLKTTDRQEYIVNWETGRTLYYCA